MRIVFMGTPSYATTILKAIIAQEEMEVVSLITQPDKPVGRKQLLTPPDTKKYLLDEQIELDIYQPLSLKNQESIIYIKDKKPDFIVVAAYGQILPKEILDIAPCINLHASLLPKYRGASPIQSAILDQNKYSGVTSMLMDVGLDTGDMLGFSVMDIRDKDAICLFDDLSHLAAQLCIKTLQNFSHIEPIKQISADSSYAKKIRKSDGEICFDDASKVYAKYLAFIFWPGIFTPNGLKLRKILLSSIEGNFKEGEIIKIHDDSVLVGCSKGVLEIQQVQPPSKKAMNIIDYIRGKRLGVGDTLS